eukprot:GILI01011512.1.p1 GENE.GILI01011512.1~~GILI01011512.1.p1  ORF type:complete len:290 (-),score=74.83 GILI01011512.1:109-978(-)
MSAILQRPHHTLLSDQQAFKPTNAHAITANGPTRAAKEMFEAPALPGDPQLSANVSLGTTIMAVAFNGGVVLAADSRTSSGRYVVNRTSNKLTKLTDNIYCCRSGSAADTQFLAEMVSNYLETQRIESGKEVAVVSGASLFHKLCYINKWGISAGIIVGGYDATNGGSVYCIPSGGCMVKLPYALGGSGSIFLYSYMDSHYKPNMTKDECLALCRSAVAHALSRDGSSGGVVRTMCITADGAEDSTTPWTAIPYTLERDPKYQELVKANLPYSSTTKEGDNVTDSSQNF